MKSKTSFFNPRGLFNGTLFRKNLTRYWPLWGMASFVGALFPLAGIMTFLQGDNMFSPLEFTEVYYNALTYAVPIVMLCYSVVAAAAVWNWLYNPRSVGMMHTLPIRREGLFVTSFLSGLAMTAIPCAVIGFLMVLLSLMSGSFQAGPLGITILGVAADGFFYFASATAAVFITGNSFALPVLYFLFHFLEPMLDFGLSFFASNMIFGLQNHYYSGAADFLSPTVFLVTHVGVNSHYAETVGRNFDGSTYTRHTLDAVTLENGWIIAAYALVGVVLLVIAWALYRLRRSECAGDVIAIGWGKPVFKAGITALAALGGGQLLYLLFFYNLMDQGYGHGYALVPLIICMTVAGLIGYYAASMLLAKTLRVFKGSLPGVGITFLCCAVLCSLMYFDVFGVARRIPTDSQIRYVQLYVAGNNYTLYPAGTVLYDDGTTMDDTELLSGLRELHQTILDHEQEIRDFDYTWYWEHDEETAFEGLHIVYFLKSGLKVERYYRLYLVKARMDDPDSFEYVLNRYVNSPELQNKRLHADDPRYRVNGGGLYVEASDQGYDLSSREAEQILAALSADADEGTWGTYNWFDRQDRLTLSLSLSFETVTGGAGDSVVRNYDYIDIYVRPEMKHTIALLKSLGYVTDADLVTRTELERRWDMEYAADDVINSAPDMSEYIMESSLPGAGGVVYYPDGSQYVYETPRTVSVPETGVDAPPADPAPQSDGQSD